ncbi:hypothetical protein ATCR1_01510 [Agrobacterium tumefaciens CCNWGS0286]|nr:hypothetical protein ATCR1_01510 [Agrobacterium tumefaciens CCNWGS0286]
MSVLDIYPDEGFKFARISANRRRFAHQIMVF